MIKYIKTKKRELVVQAERKVITFDREPDLDNANVGMPEHGIQE